MEITDEAISDLAVNIDSNKDGSIDIDEFMEAFRLTDKKSRLERGRSMFMVTAADHSKLEPEGARHASAEEEGAPRAASDLGSDSSAHQKGEGGDAAVARDASDHVG